MVRCAGKQRDGRQCGAPPMRGEQYCLFHSPEHAEDAAEARGLDNSLAPHVQQLLDDTRQP